MCLKKSFFWLLVLPFLFLLLAGGPVSAQETHPSATFAQKLTQLRTISAQAAQLAQSLVLSLSNSKAQIETLQTSLRETQDELAKFKADLEAQSVQASLSAQELAQLRDKAQTLSDSLDSLTADFSNYKTSAESKIRALEGERVLWGLGGTVVGIAMIEVLRVFGVLK